MNVANEAFITQKRAASRSAAVKVGLDYPVIDTDIHTNEFLPILEDYIHKYGGSRIVDQFNEHLKHGLNGLAAQWYKYTPEERHQHRLFRPPFWALPSKNTYDLGTTLLPSLLYERLDELGTDFAVLYPNITLFPASSGREDLRLVLSRAINHYHADIYRPYADRLTPVAIIPLHTPQEGIAELEFAVKELGLKTAIIPGSVRRPIKALAARYPVDRDPELAFHLSYLDFFGIDSEYDYDPFWAKTIELGVPPTTHSGSQSWDSRASISNYMFNHIGHFGDASQALAKALFFGGVTRRFPKFRIGLLEGGAAWGADVFTHLVDRFEKRGRDSVHNYDPSTVDQDFLFSLLNQYGADLSRGRQYTKEEVFKWAYGVGSSQRAVQNPAEVDDFALAGVKSVEDIRDLWVPNFYFGSEADDRTVVNAFNTKATPLNVQVNSFYSSDAGHWDVPEINTTLADPWKFVEEGAITAQNFKDFVFQNPYNFYTSNNPAFFKGTQVEAKLNKLQQAA